MVLDEFLYRIGFDVDSGKIRQIEQGLKNISNAAKQTAQPISRAVNESMAKNAELIGKLEGVQAEAKEWCEATREKVQEASAELHKMAQAEEEVGKNAEQAAKQTEKIGNKKPARGLRQELGELKNRFFLLGAAAAAVSGLIANYIRVPLENIQKFAKEKNKLFNITKKEIKQAQEYQDRLKDTKTALRSITTQVALKLIPTVNQSLVGFTNFLKANKVLVVEGLAKVFKWILKLGQVFTNSLRFLDKLVSSTIGWKAALLILVGVFAVVKRAMIAAFLTNPIGWVILAIGALLLLIDDLMTYLDGGESLFGDYWKPFIEWGKKALDWFKSVKPTIDRILNNIKSIFSGTFDAIIGIFKIFIGIFTADFDLIEQGWDGLWGGLKAVFNAFIDNIKIAFNIFIEGIKNLFNVAWTFISAGFENLGKTIKRPFELAFAWIKEKYDEYIAPIINAVKNFDIGQTASDMWEGAKSFFGFGHDVPKAAIVTQYADNNRTVQYQGGTATTTINVNTNNPQMANQIINNRQKNDLAFTHANFIGGY
nr:MAG TPA: tail tape measure [Caudoviricetes sp.]